MKKKVLLIFLSLLVLSMPFQEQRAQALTTKVATKVAQQALKEVVKDAATQKAFKMALDAVGDFYVPGNKYLFEEGFDSVCVVEKTPDGSCKEIIKIKKEITPEDKDKLDKSVTKKMDAKVGGALYATKYGKWLDWIVPIYAISAATVAVDYAVNGEDSIVGMIDEIAMEALEDAGIIKPAVLVEPVITDENGLLMESEEMVTYNGNQTAKVPYAQNVEVLHYHDGTTSGLQLKETRIDSPKPLMLDFVVEHDIDSTGDPTPNTFPEPYNYSKMFWMDKDYQTSGIFLLQQDGRVSVEHEIGNPFELFLNGEMIYTANQASSGTTIKVDNPKIKYSPVDKILSRYPEERIVGEPDRKYYKSHTVFLENGDKYELKYTQNSTNLKYYNGINLITQVEPGETVGHRVQWYPAGHINYTPYIPNWELETQKLHEKPIDTSIFKTDKDTIKFPPMGSMEITDTTTGQPVTITKNPETGAPELTDANGNPINEDNISVAPGTGYTPTPDGEGITYTPTNPTTENPTKEPVTIPKTPPPTEPPPTESPPVDPMPDGPNCAAKLKMPIFSPLKEQLSTSFPFSIPWDIERAAHAAFDGVGNEKPSFDMVIPVLGENHEVKIATPAFMDKWKPFMDGFLLLTFDLLLMFGLYRFVKGAGS